MAAGSTRPSRIAIEPFRWGVGDPLAAEHDFVSKLIEQVLKGRGSVYGEIDLAASEAGRVIAAADPNTCARYVLALIDRAAHWDAIGREVRASTKSEMERVNWHLLPEWKEVWPPRQVAAQTLRRLLRRKLPLERTHLLKLANWIAAAENLHEQFYPLGAFLKAIEEYVKQTPIDDALYGALMLAIKTARNSQFEGTLKFADSLENLARLPEGKPTPPALASPSGEGTEPPPPAPVGSPNILVQLKEFLGLTSPQPGVQGQTVGFDRFLLRSDSPLHKEHELITNLLPDVVERPGYSEPDLSKSSVGREMLAGDSATCGRLVLAAAERCAAVHLATTRDLSDHRFWQSEYAVHGLFVRLVTQEHTLDRDETFDILLFLSTLQAHHTHAITPDLDGLLEKLNALPGQALTPGERHVLHRLRCRMIHTPPLGRLSERVARLTHLIGDAAYFALIPGETWADAVNADLARLPATQRDLWIVILRHAMLATGSRPSAKWLKTANQNLADIGRSAFSSALLHWFPLVNATRSVPLLSGYFGSATDINAMLDEENATCLKGLLWMTPLAITSDLIRSVGAVATSTYRKIVGVGPRAVKVGNAAVYALSQIDDPLALGQLSLLKVKVKFGTAQKEIEKALATTAERIGLPREELEEMAVPAYGLTEVGRCDEPMGEFATRLSVTGTSSTELVWVKSDGKVQHSVLASVKEGHAEDLKELKAAAKDIEKMLPAQRERIDSLFLQQKTWPYPIWRERYLDHPLVGVLARRILWEFTTAGRNTTGIFFNGDLVSLDLKPLQELGDEMTVQLWHPIGEPMEEIVAWRDWLDAQQVRQPFKQAHREVYLLTEAERQTRVYSNRFAAHVIKQHQFNALCTSRGWKNKLRLMVDDEYPPATLLLPNWELRAEFWIEGAGSEYGSDTNESGVFLRLTTDQVRFYKLDARQRAAHAGGGGYHPGYRGEDAEPVPLEEIPPLVFSEVMRDVDLFVGVASVGNDPTWSDGGPEGRYRDYWQSYSFGDLSASAKTRREVLQKLIPRLKIAPLCSFDDKFLIVKGSIRSYKIHLGSGNILMLPNDQYLCIVPKQGEAESGKLHLPFEGDRTLSVILSKALLLADDDRIKDSAILSQLKRQ